LRSSKLISSLTAFPNHFKTLHILTDPGFFACIICLNWPNPSAFFPDLTVQRIAARSAIL
jgi:hypothetical protein